jgi:hypothetical protein
MTVMDDKEAYEWGAIFNSDWESLKEIMGERAQILGMDQFLEGETIIWRKGTSEQMRWVFVYDPSDIDKIRRIYADEGNVLSPCCFIIVQQPDPSDSRGDIIFDMFRLSPVSYLWHFNRVYTRPDKP